MTSIQYLAISEIIDSGKSSKNKEREKYWSINLDQIESHTGKVNSWYFLNINEIGPSTHFFEKGTVLYSKLRPYLNKVVLADRDGYATTELIPIRCNVKIALPEYVAYFLRSPKLLKFAENLVAGAKMPRMVMSEFWKYKIPIPSLTEQRRIAVILDKAEALRAKRREAIAKLDQLLQSVFLDMFGNKDFPEMRVEELALARKGAIRTGPFGSQLLHSEFTDHGIKVLGIDNAVKNKFSQGEGRYISLEKYESLKRYTVYPGDVIITIMGTCGRCAVVPGNIEKSINTKHLCCITLDNKKCNPEYLHSYFLMHPSARKYLHDRSKGAIMDGLNMGIIKEMPISCPSIELQEKYCFVKSKIQKQREKLISFEIEVENLNKSLQQQYFQ